VQSGASRSIGSAEPNCSRCWPAAESLLAAERHDLRALPTGDDTAGGLLTSLCADVSSSRRRPEERDQSGALQSPMAKVMMTRRTDSIGGGTRLRDPRPGSPMVVAAGMTGPAWRERHDVSGSR